MLGLHERAPVAKAVAARLLDSRPAAVRRTPCRTNMSGQWALYTAELQHLEAALEGAAPLGAPTCRPQAAEAARGSVLCLGGSRLEAASCRRTGRER